MTGFVHSATKRRNIHVDFELFLRVIANKFAPHHGKMILKNLRILVRDEVIVLGMVEAAVTDSQTLVRFNVAANVMGRIRGRVASPEEVMELSFAYGKIFLENIYQHLGQKPPHELQVEVPKMVN